MGIIPMGDRDHSELTCPMAKAGFTMAIGTITMAIRPMGLGIRHGAHGNFSLGSEAGRCVPHYSSKRRAVPPALTSGNIRRGQRFVT